jgi:hypothetical protein
LNVRLKPFAWLPAAIASLITPMSSKISRVRGITTSAREVMGGAGALSMIRTVVP